MAARMVASGILPRPMAGAAFGAFIEAETRRLGGLVRAAGIRAE